MYICVCAWRNTHGHTKVVAVIASTAELTQMIPEIFKRILSTFKNKTKKNENRAREEAKAKKKNNNMGIKKKKQTWKKVEIVYGQELLIWEKQHIAMPLTVVLSFSFVHIDHPLRMMISSRLSAMARIQFEDPLVLLTSWRFFRSATVHDKEIIH